MTLTETVSINVLLADDHGVVRAGLRLLLQQQEGVHMFGEAEDVPGALRLVESRRPDVLVLDLNMPGPTWSATRSTTECSPRPAEGIGEFGGHPVRLPG
jgi:DNA-binding NarL/FixJ family response regulator